MVKTALNMRIPQAIKRVTAFAHGDTTQLTLAYSTYKIEDMLVINDVFTQTLFENHDVHDCRRAFEAGIYSVGINYIRHQMVKVSKVIWWYGDNVPNVLLAHSENESDRNSNNYNWRMSRVAIV